MCILVGPISLSSEWWLSNRATDWPGYADPRRHLSCRLPRRCSTNTEPDLPEPMRIMHKNRSTYNLLEPLRIMHKNRTISLPDESHRRDRTSMKAGFQCWEQQQGEVPSQWAPRIVGTRSSPWRYCRWGSRKKHKIYLGLSFLWG